MYKVRVTAAVAALRGGGGTRRRGGREWGRAWQVIDVLPEGVADDPHLEVVEISPKEAARLRPERLGEKPTSATTAAKGTPPQPDGSKPPIPDELESLAWPKLQALGRAYGVTGKKTAVLAGLKAKGAAASVAEAPPPPAAGSEAPPAPPAGSETAE